MLSHYHAVRVLGASAFDAEVIVAHENTRALVAERGKQDWASEFARMPRLAEGADSVPGLTWPTLTFSDRLTIDLGGDRGDLVLQYCGRGHTEGDIVAWLPRQRILFAGDLVEAEAALYTGDAFHREWATSTLDRVAGARRRDAGRRARRGQPRARDAVDAAIAQTRGFLEVMIREVGAVHAARRHAQGGVRGHARRAGRRLRPVADLRALPAVRRLPAVGRAVRHRASGDLDRRARPGGLGAAAGLTTMNRIEPGNAHRSA